MNLMASVIVRMRFKCIVKRYACHGIALIAAIWLAGCVAASKPPAAVVARPALAPAGDSGWWFVRFRMNWPEHIEPAWHMDLLVAHEVIKPVIDSHSPDIYLWRFHRRAARDAAGHQFSFIFFATPETARKVFAQLSQNSTLALARSAGRILEIAYDDTAAIARPEISGTSDPNWSEPLRKAWPFYLMGASQMWLDLIAGMADNVKADQPTASFDDLDRRFAGINATITTLWQNEGRHAFLHHLNALFGYEPIFIIEKRHMRF
jgi:hypothetical protein